MSREQTKAARYIQLLDHARCSGDWNAVPELVRKVRKHAPERACLTLTAISEHSVVQAAQTKDKSTGLSNLIKPLADAIDKERRYPEDDFQAKVCLVWIYWVLGDHTLAAEQLQGNIEQEFSQLDGTGKESTGWTKICALKASYIKGTLLAKSGASGEALETFWAVMPILSGQAQPSSSESELRTWTELLLTQFCILSSQLARTKRSQTLETDCLAAFRSWAKFWDRQPMGGFHLQADVSRRFVWKEYYATLSIILQDDLPYPTTSLATSYVDNSTRRKQRAELQRVEAAYENLILKEISFPRAEQASEEVEDWVYLVVQNWKILCGNSWQEEELGEGGRDAASRNVLDILYRAATKTFHSTAILRHLFTVHLAVADFDLAFKAFDTYVEIVKKGKARVEKTGEVEQGLDDDEIVLRTVSEAIRALCRYGSRREAEKAKGIAHFFRDWLLKHYPEKVITNGNGRKSDSAQELGVQYMDPHVRAMIWGAVGIAEAQWARMTFEAAERSDIQLEAIKCLGKSLSREYGCSKDIDSLFALAMVFAERRELASALEVVKSALLPPPTNPRRQTTKYNSRFGRERALIPLWHLLALLLSARQEFTTAARACEGAFEQFQDPVNLFGDNESGGAYRSEHLNEKQHENSPRSRGVVDDMDDFEKETVLEIKMTQLALVEIIEGPEAAVNASDELLSLYSRLFGGGPSSGVSAIAPKSSQTVVPQSSAGTLRSLKGSIFGRRSTRTSAGPPISGQMKTLVERPQTSQTFTSTTTRAPTIHVTNENGDATERTPHREKLQKKSGSLRKKDSHSRRERSVSANRARTSDVSRASSTEVGSLDLNPPRLSQVGIAISSEGPLEPPLESSESQELSGSQTLPHPTHNMLHKEQTLKSLGGPGQQDTRLPSGHKSSLASPLTRLSKSEQHRRRVGILVRVWLLIAGFYRRADMFDDAKGAIEEAEKLVQSLADETEKDSSGNITPVDIVGWGQKKSVEELWGDVFSERGYLSVAKDTPYVALGDFEAALIHFADHPSAIVGLSNLLLDVYSEQLPPLPSIPSLQPPISTSDPSASRLNAASTPSVSTASTPTTSTLLETVPQVGPLGLPTTTSRPLNPVVSRHLSTSVLEPPHKASSTALLDRLAARDRAYGLLNGLTKLGSGWNYSEAWYTLARAYEEGGQAEKARDVLWWCVELEEGRGVRKWDVVGVGGYVL